MTGAEHAEPIRLAEVIAALSLATDLGLGQPLEHELGVCLASVELAARAGCETEERSHAYYVALLLHVGCTAAAPFVAGWVGGDDVAFQRGASVLGPASEPAEDLRFFLRGFAADRPLPQRVWLTAGMLAGGKRRFEEMAAGMCEGARLLAGRLRLPDEVARALGQLTERWDGKGVPGECAGEDISRPLRVVRVAHDAVTVARAADLETARRVLERRRGRGYDPAVVDAALADLAGLVGAADARDAWERVIDAEPSPPATISGAGLESLARAFGEFADVKVGFLRGHSSRVGDLAAAAAPALDCGAPHASVIRVAGHLHDLGRVAVPNGIWERAGALSGADWERVRLHPYYTERVLERSPALASYAALAGSHHERLDGSGYHRAAAAAQLGPGARLLAAADAYDAMTHDRPHRRALAGSAVRRELAAAVSSGLLDGRAVDAVLEVAGEEPVRARQGLPAGLTAREAEVLRLLAQGLTNREIAERLVITEKTAGHHVEHIYAKAQVATRVGAALFAMRHDLAG